MTSSKFVDLSAGMFLYEQTVDDETWVCDSQSASSDVQFGLASWDGWHGPVSGRCILKALPTRVGGWGQVSDEVWAWCMPDGQELDEPPPSWPRIVNVLDSPHAAAFAGLAGTVFGSEALLTDALREITQTLPKLPLRLAGADARLVAAQWAHPHIFGEPHMASSEAH